MVRRLNKRKPIEWEEKENGCWECISHSKSREGYPLYANVGDGGTRFMSRHIWMQMFGEIPKGMVVCHKCDNPACINPEHLFLGTRKDNMDDMVNKNRQIKGKDCHCSKLTEQQVLEIFRDVRTQKIISAEYRVSERTVWKIRNRISWKYITNLL